MATKHPTRLVATYAEWVALGCPIGAIIPVTAEDAAEHARLGATPARYQGCEMYYVALPNAEETKGVQLWCPWMKAYNAEKGYHGEGWDITGPIEAMTARPSIQTSVWHGFLTNGILSVSPEV